MNSIKALSNRVAKVKAAVPPHQTERPFDVSLLTDQELEQLHAFLNTLSLPLDLEALTDEQRRERRHWLDLERALYEGDTAKAAKLRGRHEVTLEQLVERFLNLDISSIPDGKVLVDKGNSYSHASYRNIKINYIEMDKSEKCIDKLWRWVEYFNG